MVIELEKELKDVKEYFRDESVHSDPARLDEQVELGVNSVGGVTSTLTREGYGGEIEKGRVSLMVTVEEPSSTMAFVGVNYAVRVVGAIVDESTPP